MAQRRIPAGERGLAAIGKVVATRETRTGIAAETRHYIMSAELSPERLRHTMRSHWAIGNSLHWVLDVTMNGDLGSATAPGMDRRTSRYCAAWP